MEKIIHGDCLEKLKELPENSVDSIVTDPPYGLEFMGKAWDKFKNGENTGGGTINDKTKVYGRLCGKAPAFYNIDNNAFQDFCFQWSSECLRVLKPGGHLLSFGGTRTYHRMACAIEDAGFEIRDMIEWVYGSGFPKSLNIGKAVDKIQGNEREVVGSEQKAKPTFHSQNVGGEITEIDNIELTKGTSEWEGWGTALKPAHEPIVWATKSLTFNKDFAILEDINNNLISTIWQSLENLQKQDTSKLQETVLIHLNTALLWQNILAELLKNESKFTTSTVSKMTTELKILNSLLLKNTQDDTDGKSQTYQNGTQESQVNGLDLLVSIVENCLAGEKKNMTDIQTLIAQGLATYKQSRTGMNVKNVEQDLLPIILNANSVLINVLTDITTELNQNELSTFVNFAEKSLKQYLAEPQSIADENVWQEHIKKTLPNHSPICMARKPLSEKTVALNVLKWGTGGIEIDGCRIPTSEDMSTRYKSSFQEGNSQFVSETATGSGKRMTIKAPESISLGRFPANLIHDNSEEVRECFPDSKSSNAIRHNKKDNFKFFSEGEKKPAVTSFGFSDEGNASRFFKSIPSGRFPANLIHDNSEEVRECFPESNATNRKNIAIRKDDSTSYGGKSGQQFTRNEFGDKGNASRFFKSIIYQSKASKRERNFGCEELYILKDGTPEDIKKEIETLLNIAI